MTPDFYIPVKDRPIRKEVCLPVSSYECGPGDTDKLIYCVKCKKKTENGKGAKKKKLKNGIRALEVECAVCENRKNRFLPGAPSNDKDR